MQKALLTLAILLLPFSAAHAQPLVNFVSSPYATPRQAVVSIRGLGMAMQKQRDRRALFPLIYALTIEATERKLATGGFRNKAWVNALVVNYANIYRHTILKELSGERAHLPYGWQLEFQYVAAAAPVGKWQADLDVVYGIHVHIARDLVEALLITPTKFTTPSIHADFLLITQSLRESMPQIWRLYEAYNRDEQFLPELQQSVMMKWISDLRSMAWDNAKDYSALKGSEKTRALRELDWRTTNRARRHGTALPLLPVSS